MTYGRHPTEDVIAEMLADTGQKSFLAASDYRLRLEHWLDEINREEDFTEFLLTRALLAYSRGAKPKMPTSQQIILGHNDNLFLRMNLWPSFNGRQARLVDELAVYSYEEPHDHNFDFLTIGAFGPGYSTDIYSYSSNRDEMLENAAVALEYVESFHLSRGKKYWFQSGRHVHIQRLPESFSSSINIIIKNEAETAKPQFYFDLSESTAKRLTDNTVGKQKNFLALCAHLKSEKARELLTYYERDSGIRILREHASRLLADLPASR